MFTLKNTIDSEMFVFKFFYIVNKNILNLER